MHIGTTEVECSMSKHRARRVWWPALAIWSLCFAITAALALAGRAGSPLAAAVILAYCIPIGATAMSYGRLEAGALAAASVLASTLAWPAVALPARLPLLAFQALASVAVLGVTPWMARVGGFGVSRVAHRPAHAPGGQMLSGASSEGSVPVSHGVFHGPGEGASVPVQSRTAPHSDYEGEDRFDPGTASDADRADSEGSGDAGRRSEFETTQSGPAEEHGFDEGERGHATHSEPDLRLRETVVEPGIQNGPLGSSGPPPVAPTYPTADPESQPPAVHVDRRAAVFTSQARDEAGLLLDLFGFCRAQVPGVDRGIFYRSAGEDRLEPADSFGFEASELGGVTTRCGVGLVGVVARTGKSQVVDDLQIVGAEPGPMKVLYAQAGLHSAIAGPLVETGSILGVLVLYALRPGAFTLSDRTAVERACGTASPLLSNIRNLSELRGELREAQFLIEMTGILSRPQGLDDLVEYLIDKAKVMVGGDVASVMLVDPATRELSIVRADGLPAEVVTGTKIPMGSGIAGWVAANSKPLILRDFPVNGHRANVEWAVSVPLTGGGEVVGVVNVGSTTRDKTVSDDDLNMLLGLASQAGVCIYNARAVTVVQQLHFDTMRALVAALETADPYGRGHSENVARYGAAIAKRMQLPEETVKTVETAGMLHDIGKVGLGEGVLRKSKPLTTIEQVAIRFHPAMATEILREVPMLAGVIPAVAHHHEWFNGGGYGEGLKGGDIPLEARILAVADAFEAMTSKRAYRGAMTREEALEELSRGSGKQFDPAVVEVFRAILDEESQVPRSGSAAPSEEPTL